MKQMIKQINREFTCNEVSIWEHQRSSGGDLGSTRSRHFDIARTEYMMTNFAKAHCFLLWSQTSWCVCPVNYNVLAILKQREFVNPFHDYGRLFHEDV
jgi:hypothetical protein